MKAVKLKSPFPYFGGKSRVADIVWSRLGDVRNYVEPFAGSLAVLWLRPHAPRVETVNDLDCMVANFWRATRHAPEAVAEHADGPVNEADLHARHRWLVLSDDAAEFRRRMRQDPDHFDPKIAGWWCWGLCCWIGGGWCTAHGETTDGGRKQCIPTPLRKGVNNRGGRPEEWEQVPHLSDAGRGIAASGESRVKGLREKQPTLEQCRTGGKGVNSNGTLGACDARRAWLVDWFGRLRDRLRLVRVCCGDWLRVCGSESVTTRLGTTGVFFDPPYSAEAGRDNNLYAQESATVSHAVRAYCVERGSLKDMRICLAGYDTEHSELESHGWSVVEWAARGGYGNRSAKGKANAKRERLWFSPHCLVPVPPTPPPRGLFDGEPMGE